MISSSYGTTERLTRLESLVEKLVYSLPTVQNGRRSQEAATTQLETPANSDMGAFQDDSAQAEVPPLESRRAKRPEQFSFNYNPLDYILTQQDDGLSSLARISQVLHAELPCAEDVAHLTGGGHGSVFLNFCHYFHGDNQHTGHSPEPLRLPSATSHPVLLAKALLHLAFCLQHAMAFPASPALYIKKPYNAVASRWIQMATKLVTSNDHFIDSVEALQCLLIEGYSLIDTGSLRRAWISFRRALSFAQIMGFHRKNGPPLKKLHESTQYSRVYIWTAIVYQERMLAFLIGTPAATTGAYLTDEDMEIGSASARLGKRHGLIISQLLERSASRSCNSPEVLHSIDCALQSAAATVPVTWWQMAFATEHMSAIEYVANVTQAHTQIIHFSLVLWTHLPFLMKSDAGLECTSSKFACLNAAREILSRFNTLRGYVKAVFCCRLAEFCAFHAGMTLLLAYMDNINGGLRDALEDQRPGDLALITLTMETMGKLCQENNDAVSGDAVESMKKLFDFYQYAIRHGEGRLSIRILREENNPGDTFQWPEQAEPSGPYKKACRFFVPYYGTVCIIREDLEPQALPSSLTSSATTPFSTAQTLTAPAQLAIDQSDSYFNNHGRCLPAHLGSPQTPGFCSTPLGALDVPPNGNLVHPEFFAEGNDWGLQGVDMTFFNSLVCADTPQHGFSQ